MSAAVAGLLTVVATLVALVTPAPAMAAGTGWYMLVNDLYDGVNAPGPMRCLSTNAQPPAGGSGTHQVYLAGCNASTPGQWWWIDFDWGRTVPHSIEVTNYQNFDNAVWELSSNLSTPPGNSAGTYAAYTAQRNQADGHQWSIFYDSGSEFKTIFVSKLSPSYALSASASNPLPGGGYRVYTSHPGFTAAQHWRQYQPSNPPACSPCGRID
ncbi:hypothetical protein [Actinoplanes sp. NPDC026623]|uniref:hypothetical protein n=1 Tax=Actinoplanes sp. NPDC026623 TaxID=3155610 RepID=UPI00340F6399